MYLDTIGLLGAISTSFDALEPKIAFGVGATLASFFFFSLGYGARLLAPVFERPRAWTLLDIAIAVIIWAIATSLVLGRFAAT